ncbi:MAG: CcmD family protein [SAR202 cluster bacterium]|nr:CcmD family protein [SAR202 cluster bacterium]
MNYLFAVFAITWLVYFGYLFVINRKIEDVKESLDKTN